MIVPAALECRDLSAGYDKLVVVRKLDIAVRHKEILAVLGLCEEIHVLDFGALIASGGPDAIRGDQRVAGAYLGATHAKADRGQDRHPQEGHAKEAHVKETHA